ncbi:MAG: hypothetical protein IT441_03825 [Phycisphaeraceae bacterium]|nr:hypothetical protein [Phycisphaeraceae bacterium]
MSSTTTHKDDPSFDPPSHEPSDALPAALDEDCYCHHCGYNFRTLRLTPESTCPECGHPVAVSIDAARFRPIPTSESWRRLRRGNAWYYTATLTAALGPVGAFGTMIFLDWLRLLRHVDDDLVAGGLVGALALVDGLSCFLGSRHISWVARTTPTGRYRGRSRPAIITAALLASWPCLLLAVTFCAGSLPGFWFSFSVWMRIIIGLLLAALATRVALVAVVGGWYRLLLRDLGRPDIERLARGYAWLLILSGLVLIAGIILVQTYETWRHWLPLSMQQSGTADVMIVTAIAGGCIGGWIGCAAAASLFYRVARHLRKPQP